jgi:hypothetical protein
MEVRKTVSFRASAAEIDEMKANAKRSGMNFSQYIRSQTTDQKKPTVQDAIELLKKLFEERDAEIERLQKGDDEQ